MFDVRPVQNRDELAKAFYGIGQYFGRFPQEDQLDRWTRLIEMERMHAAFDNGEIKGPREWSSFARPLERRGQVRFVTPEEAKELFPPVWEELGRQRPGVFARTPEWWETRNLRLPPEQEANPKRFVVLELDGA